MPHESEMLQARGYEAEGNLGAARTVYESLLKADPAALAIRLRLSALEQVTGNYRASHHHAVEAGRTLKQARSWKDLAKVTQRLLSFDERDAVYELIIGADWAHVDIVAQSAVLSQQLWLTNHFQEALELIETARARAQPSYALSYSRANALRYCGRMLEATAEYEHCLELAPDYAYAHWSLAYHQSIYSAGSRIDRVVKAKRSVSESAPEYAYLCYALFKELDDSGETDQAWAALREGMRSKRRSIRYDSSREQCGFLALRKLIEENFFAGTAQAEIAGATPIFIVGMPRTGTTIMERMLSNHNEIATGGELNDFHSALCWESNRFLDSSLNPASVAYLSNVDFSGVGYAYLKRIQGKAGKKTFLIDKNPMNFSYVGYISKALPKAKIICLNRNPMDACFSNLKELFSGEAYGYSYDMEELADHYLRFRALSENWQRILPQQVCIVDYERLVSDPSTHMEKIMQFCGVDFEPDCVDITKNEAPVSTASSSQVRQPINTKGVGAWRRYAKQLEPLRARFREAMPDSA